MRGCEITNIQNNNSNGIIINKQVSESCPKAEIIETLHTQYQEYKSTARPDKHFNQSLVNYGPIAGSSRIDNKVGKPNIKDNRSRYTWYGKNPDSF